MPYRTYQYGLAGPACHWQGEFDAFADRGYFSSVEIQACEQQGITPLVPKPVTSNNRALEFFDKRDFIYLAQSNEYVYPTKQRAQWHFKTAEREKAIYRYCDLN